MIAAVNKQRRGKHSKIYRTEILQMSICRDEETKVKNTELKHSRCKYEETRRVK